MVPTNNFWDLSIESAKLTLILRNSLFFENSTSELFGIEAIFITFQQESLKFQVLKIV
jgi:hypothetical protein